MRSFIALGLRAGWMSLAGMAVAENMTPEMQYATFVDCAKAVSPIVESDDHINLATVS